MGQTTTGDETARIVELETEVADLRAALAAVRATAHDALDRRDEDRSSSSTAAA